MYMSVLQTLPLYSGKYKVLMEVGSVSTELIEKECLYKANHNQFIVGDWQYVHMWKFINT